MLGRNLLIIVISIYIYIYISTKRRSLFQAISTIGWLVHKVLVVKLCLFQWSKFTWNCRHIGSCTTMVIPLWFHLKLITKSHVSDFYYTIKSGNYTTVIITLWFHLRITCWWSPPCNYIRRSPYILLFQISQFIVILDLWDIEQLDSFLISKLPSLLVRALTR